MAWVTHEFVKVWESGEYVGEHAPHAVVQVQLGHWVRGWYKNGQVVHAGSYSKTINFPRVKASIWGEGGYGPRDAQDGHWSAIWLPTTGWFTVPNLVSVHRTKSFDAKGMQVMEVVLDAMDYVPKTGALGEAYHVIAPGWLAPARSYVSPYRAAQPWQTEANESPWAPLDGEERLSDSVVMRVWEGLGAPETEDGHSPPLDGGSNGAWVFRGMIDDVDTDGDPNQITLTARAGKLLTDQRLFRASKSVQISDPISFYDREAAGKEAPVGFRATASSSAAAHPPKLVLDRAAGQDWDPNAERYKTFWQSALDVDGSHLEWLEISLPQGRYDEFFMVSELGQQAYIGIYAKPIIHYERPASGQGDLHRTESAPLMDGEPLTANAWVNLHGNAPGQSWPYVRAFNTGSTLPYMERGGPDGRRVIDQVDFGNGRVFQLGERSILRIGFLRPGGAGRAQVSALFGLRRYGVQKEIEQARFILVDDATEVIKVVLRWAGYDEWDIEDARVRLSDGHSLTGPGGNSSTSGRLVYDRSKFLVDVIDDLAKQLGWVFFIADPTDGDSEGVPTFRRDASMVVNNGYIAAKANADTMLTGVKYKRSDEMRPYIIRVRGAQATARGGGVPLGGDRDARLMATYLPQWAFGSRTGGVLRHIVYTANELTSYAQCLYGALVIAINAALEMHTCTVEIPGHPLVELDDQVSVTDEATGINSRLWVVKSDDTLTLGENASWKMSVEGSLLDTQDMQDVMQEILGKKPLHYGSNNKTYVLEKVNWNHVVNPASGHASWYASPVTRLHHPDQRSRIR